MPQVSPIDGLVVVILIAAALRGLVKGLIREVFSIAALGGACIAARYGATPGAQWLVEATRGEIGTGAAPWIAGSVIALTTLAIVALTGRVFRRGARAAGLGWADRLGGGALGAAEGALVAGLILVGIGWVIGQGHPILAQSRSAVAFEQLQAVVQERAKELPSVATPPG